MKPAHGKHLWDPGMGLVKATKESPEAYRVFSCYLGLGRHRSLKKAAEVAHVSMSTIGQYSSKYNWQERAAYYDRHMVEKFGEEVRKEYKNKHKAALAKFAEKQQARAKALGKLADLMIEITTQSIEEMQQAGEVIDRQQLAAIARTAAALADSSLQVGAASLGVDDLIEAISPEDE